MRKTRKAARRRRKTGLDMRVAQARKAVARFTPTKAGTAIKDTWSSTLTTLTSAEENLEKQVRALLKKNKISTKDAATMLQDVRALVGRERRRALKQLDTRLKTLQARIHKERKVVGKMVNDGVQSALAAFNIPSRHEVAELTRKVDLLSKKIDTFRRR